MIVIGKIEIRIIMVIEIMEDLVIETMKEIVIVTGAMKEIGIGTTTIKTEQDTAGSAVGRGATLMDITVNKLYTCSLFLLHKILLLRKNILEVSILISFSFFSAI